MSTLELERTATLDRTATDADAVAQLTAPEYPTEPLTARELLVLRYLSSDATLAEIAARLFVTRNTVKTQVRSVYRKLGVSSRSDALERAHGAGLR
ncbi:helix-turn-helix domain-containing protein [Pengzhenrongella sicca]|uniref:Helix-turn-helix transcriptional regulator n=1 Tax=Pengzhenrongella sicca TaxID=2819238 RepID=A0A8A4Z8H5_9MICO|nr:helix-turn-helix transcriptional regulator [Pengzhenrongella sicca]QTE28220.1 helix-turn-helix transcriptional regulator [Pengzhenrongella sicca]